MRLLIISHVIHYAHQGKLYAYGPYAREIEVWANLFPEVVIASPLRTGELPPGDSLEIKAPNVRMAPQHEGGGDAWWPKLKLAMWVPAMLVRLCRQMWAADAIHVRLPGNLGFLGALLAPLFRRPMVAKYAGPWPDLRGESVSEVLQKRVLRYWFRGPVTMYGDWPNLPPHVIPFMPSLLTAAQLERGRTAAARRKPSAYLRVLYTGRLSAEKRVDTLIRAIAKCREEGHAVHCTVIGDGAERGKLEKLVDSLGARESVTFTGAVAFERVLDHLEQADCLVLASDVEGFGKSLAEAMAFGLICIGPNTGIGAQLLAGRGFTATPGNTGELADILCTIADSPDRCQYLRERALRWASRFSLEGLESALKELLEKHWQVRLLPHRKVVAVAGDAGQRTAGAFGTDGLAAPDRAPAAVIPLALSVCLLAQNALAPSASNAVTTASIDSGKTAEETLAAGPAESAGEASNREEQE